MKANQLEKRAKTKADSHQARRDSERGAEEEISLQTPEGLDLENRALALFFFALTNTKNP